MSDTADILGAVRTGIDRAAACRWRLALVLTGKREANLLLAQRLVDQAMLHDAYWLSDCAPPSARTRG